MNKSLIQSRFSKHLEDYNKNAKIQKLMAEKLSGLLSKKHYENVLEIGCGTGFLTRILNKKISFKKYYAVDIVENCKDYISKINPEINFINCDIENYVPDFKPDLIISNATLQWTENFESTIKKLKMFLNKDGEFIFSTFGKEHFREIFYISGTSLNYYSETELQQMFPDSVVYLSEIHVMGFKTPTDVLKHLKFTGVNGIENNSWTKKDLTEFENAYTNLCGMRPTLTYNPIYIKM